MKFLTYFYFCIIFYFALGDKEKTACTVRESTENVQENDQPLYVLECTLASDQSIITDLIPIVKTTQIHGDSDDDSDNTTTLDPNFVDELHLTGEILKLPPNAFSWLPNLRRLQIESRSPLETRETTFAGLTNLTSLTVIGKFTSESIAPTDVFPDSIHKIGSNLNRLIIQDADLNGELSGKEMGYFPNLKEFGITNSSNFKLAQDEYIFIKNNRLEKLDLKRISIKEYPKSLTNLDRLKFLRLSNVQLIDLPSNAFANFASTLRELHLAKNLFTTLNANVFQNLKSLKILSLANNQLSNLPDKIFGDLSKLDELNLSGNRFQTLPDNLFQNLSQLSKLDLSKNQLINITQSIVVGLDRLMHLDLSDNRLRNFHVNLNPQLSVSLASNNISQFPEGFFDTTSSFNRLILSTNPLDNLNGPSFSGVSIGAGNLYLQRVNFTILDLSIFHGMKNSNEQAQIFVSNCPNLISLNVSLYSIRWPNNIKQIVFTNNPKFVLVEPNPNDDGELLSRFIRKAQTQFVFDGVALCDCRWNWLRTGKYSKKEEREQIVEFGVEEESSPTTCCNIPNLTVDDFLEQNNFEKYCNGTLSIAKETSIDICPHFDLSEEEEPEAKKR